MPKKKKVILLLSGGIDSVTILALLKSQDLEIYALSFNYGQRHLVELAAIQDNLKKFPVKDHKVVNLDLRLFGGSALTDAIEVPKSKEFQFSPGVIPVTYVPARNTIFLSFALGYAETVGSTDIYIGANKLDAANYPDCRKEFISCFQQLANLGTRSGSFQIHGPLLDLDKSEIIQMGLDLGVDYCQTTSCYDAGADGLACGECDACHLRLKGFAKLNRQDPAQYRNRNKSAE